MAAKGERRRQAGPLAGEIGEALLATASGEGLIACGLDRRIVFCNPAGATFLRIPRARAGEADLPRLLARLSDETLELRFLSALRDRSPVEFVVATPAGDDEWTEVRGLPTPSGMVFFLRDVTDRERSERDLRRKERRLRAASESLRLAHQAARAATWEWRTGDRLRWLDIAAARALIGLPGHAQDDEEIADWRSFVAEEDLPVIADSLLTLADADETTFEFRVAGVDGHYWLKSSAAVVERRADGGPARVTGVTLDVTPHKLAEAKLQREIQERLRAEQRQLLLIHELNHRVKNMLATVQSVARQSLGRAQDGGPLADFEDRLMALAWTHDILTKERWVGASLNMILSRTLAPHATPERVELDGPDLRVSPKMALALAMGVHELATNAVKYGALSNETGRITMRWGLEKGWLTLTWQERGGPAVKPPASRGFGSRLLERGLAHELGGQVEIRFEPAGVRCTIAAPFQAESSEDAGLAISAAVAGQVAAPH
jgi:two-component sensor histidine kinase